MNTALNTALFTSPRVLTLSGPAVPQVGGQPALVPLQLSGSEGLNRLFEYRLVLQTPDALAFTGDQASNFPLSDFIGRELTCHIELEGHGSFVAGLPGGAGTPNQGAGVREISGLVTGARYLGLQSRHALYELTLRPWLHLATLTNDCKVFQDQTPVQVIRAVLADYAFATEVRLIETYPVRDYCVQYNETDFEFVSRLLQEWGINYHFEHSGGVHRLILSDHNGAFSPLQKDKADSAYHVLSYYPPGHKVDGEYIHAFTPAEQITSGQFASRDFDYTRPKVQLSARTQAPRSTGHAEQDVYLWRGGKTQGMGSTTSGALAGSDYSQPNKGADKGANQTEPQGQHLARLRMQALRQAGLRASGSGHVRGIAPGCTFKLQNHPQSAANTEYLTLTTQLLVENVSEDTARGSTTAGSAATVPTALSDTERLTSRWRVLCDFEVQPTTELLRPEATQPKPHTFGPETARVCGAEEDNIHTDPLGRIKVQFPWDRYGPLNQHSSCWVRVSAAWAGNQLGAMHLPRVGQEVIIDFLGGDPDLPICTGRVYNQMNTPPWALPAQQALSGFRSRELNPGGGNSAAGRSNHLVLDDTEQKIQAQLKSDHDHSSLSLGHITRIEDNQGRKDARGEGFELRTDGHGAIRAKDGLLISTEGRTAAQAHITDMGETTSRLEQAQAQHKAQDPEQGEVAQAIAEQNKAIKGSATGKPTPSVRPEPVEGLAQPFPELREPHLVLASPAGIESTTPQSTHQHSGEHHAITSGAHTSISAGKSLLVAAEKAIRLFAYKAGLKIVSAVANVDIQALDKSMHFLAKVKITETANRITFSAKEEIVINGGGSYTIFKASGIEDGTSGSWVAHAGSHSLPGGKSLPFNMSLSHISGPPYSLRFAALGSDALLADAGFAGKPYQLLDEQGHVLAKGAIGADGVLPRLRDKDEPKRVTLLVGSMQCQLKPCPAPTTSAEDSVQLTDDLSDEDLEALTQSPYYTALANNPEDADFLGAETIKKYFA